MNLLDSMPEGQRNWSVGSGSSYLGEDGRIHGGWWVAGGWWGSVGWLVCCLVEQGGWILCGGLGCSDVQDWVVRRTMVAHASGREASNYEARNSEFPKFGALIVTKNRHHHHHRHGRPMGIVVKCRILRLAIC